jgi:hypothetical protein
MDNTTTATTTASEIATEPVVGDPHKHLLSAHELRVILHYRAASDEARDSVRRMLATHSMTD